MTLADDVDLEEFVMAKDDLSGADIKAVCTEAGLLALRERRMRVTHEDFKKVNQYPMDPLISHVCRQKIVLYTRKRATYPKVFTSKSFKNPLNDAFWLLIGQ